MAFRLKQTPDPSQPVKLLLVVGAGRLNEDPDQNGIAHLVEHVVVNHGSASFPDSWARIVGRGLWAQALTSDSSTYYEVAVPKDRPDDLDLAMRGLRAWASEASMLPKDIDTQRPIVIEENRSSDSPEFFAQQQVTFQVASGPCNNEALANAHDASIMSASYAAVQRFYKDWYRPERETIIMVGPINPDEAEARLRSVFGTIPKREAAPRADTRERCTIKLDGGNHVYFIKQPGLARTTLLFNMKRPRPPVASDETERVRRKFISALIDKALARHASAWGKYYRAPASSLYFRMNFEASAFEAGVEVNRVGVTLRRPKDALAAVEDLSNDLQRLRTRGLDPEDFAAAMIAQRKELEEGTTPDLARIAYMIAGPAEEQPAQFGPAEQLEILRSITSEEVNRRLAELIDLRSNLDIALVAAPDVFRDISSQASIRARVDAVLSGPPPSALPLPAKPALLMSKEQRAALATGARPEAMALGGGVLSVKLRNNIHVLVRATESVKEGDVAISAVRTAPVAGSIAAIAQSAASLANNSGAGHFDKFALADYAQSRNLTFSGIALDKFGGRAPASRLEDLLQLIHLSLTAPRWDAAALEDWKMTNEAEARDRQAAEGAAAVRAIEAGRFGRPVDADGGPPKPVTLGLDDARSAFRAAFGDMSKYSFVVTGALDVQSALPLLDRYLGSLPSVPKRGAIPIGRKEGAASPRPVWMQPRLSREIRAGTGKSASVIIRVPGSLPADLAERVKLELLGTALQQRVADRIRNKEGGSYMPLGFVSQLGGAGPADNAYLFSILFECDPARAGQLKQAALDEISRLQRDGLDPELFERSKAEALVRPTGLTKETPWHQRLVSNVDRTSFSDDDERIAELRKKIFEQLTEAEMKEAARRYLDLGHALEIVRRPAEVRAPSGEPSPAKPVPSPAKGRAGRR
jgi:zinc protease